MRYLFVCIYLIFNCLTLNAQVVHQQAYWIRLYARIKFDDKWSLQFEADERRFIQPDKQLQFIAHTHLHRKFGKYTEGSVGMTFSSVRQGDFDVPEWRPFQEFYVYLPVGKGFRLSHRLRTEQRWFHNYDKIGLIDGYNYKNRIRFRPQLDWKMSEHWALKLNDEVMYHINDDFDQNRVFAGFEYRFDKHTSLELGYLKVYQKRSGGKGYYDRDNLRVTFYKDFEKKKVEQPTKKSI